VLDGRQGDDTLIGGFQADTYAFTAGYGFDTIIEMPDAPGVIDRVVFGASVRPEDLAVRRNGNDLVIDLGNGVDVLTIVGGLAATRVERFEFADGAVWSIDQVIDRMLTGGAGDDHLIGLDNRNDTLAGGAGSDALEGGLGDDTYRFGVGDGSDSISDSGGIDRVVFGAGITADAISFRNVDGDILITLAGTQDRLAILQGYSTRSVETFAFADGSVLTLAEVRARILADRTLTGQDLLDARDLPTDGAVLPGAGHDRIILAQGGRIEIAAGDGIDSVEIPGGVSASTVALTGHASGEAVVRLAGADSTDLIIAFPASGDELVVRGALGGGALPTIEFADGVTWDGTALVQASIAAQQSPGDDLVLGSARDDVLAGGKGDDLLRGGAGNDTYSFVRGDGRDVIEDAAGNDVLAITGYRPDDLIVSQIDPARAELVLSFADSADQIVLRYGGNWYGE